MAIQNQSGANYRVGNNYLSQQSGTRRHEFTSATTQTPIPLGEYVTQVLVGMKRSFGAGSDDPPTPTASNNYQTSQVFNGSKILDYECKVRVNNTGSGTGIYLDVYLITCSFSDTAWMNTITPSTTPIEMETSDIATQGDVSFKSPAIVWTENVYKNSKTLQRNISNLGTVFVSSEDGGTPQAEFTLRGLPAKVRRSQTGMFYALKYLGYFYYGQR